MEASLRLSLQSQRQDSLLIGLLEEVFSITMFIVIPLQVQRILIRMENNSMPHVHGVCDWA